MAGGDNVQPRYAPWYQIPARRIVAVEHPGIVKNVDRAINTLQGEAGITKILDPSKPTARAQLFLRPEDPLARPIQSINRQTNNVLLKITVPKWTGRKRKRGSDEPFTLPTTPEEIEKERHSCSFRWQSLRDNATKYSVEAVGTVERTHNYRSIPDFVFSTTASPFTQRFRDTVLSFDFEKMRRFDISMNRGETKNVDLIPPPAFSKTHIPFQYTYRQNPTVKVVQDAAGNVKSVNTQIPHKVLTHIVPYDVAEVPSKPREECPPVSSLEPVLQETVAAIEKLFSERPAWTRRALRNQLTAEQDHVLRHAIAYVGYIFRSGPWRDAIVKLGHDPRTDVEFRKYQTFIFRVQTREPDVARDGGGSAKRQNGGGRDFSGLDISTIPTVTREEHPENHLWTGKAPLPLDGKIWMVCDIVDPIVRDILYPPNPAPDFLRAECEPISDGWYGNGTLAKAKTIIRQKINALTQQHREPADSEYECILGFPDHANDETCLQAFHLNPETATPRDSMLATEVRATIKGAANWRGAIAAGKIGTVTGGKMMTEDEEEEREATRRVMEEEAEASPDEDDEDEIEEEEREEEEGVENDDEEEVNNEDGESMVEERVSARAAKRQVSEKGKEKQKRV